METYFNYTHVAYKNENELLIKVKPLIKSSKLAHEFLAMQCARFKDNDTVITDQFNPSNLNINEEGFAEVCIAQFSSVDETVDADYYTIIDSIKLIVLDVPRSCKVIEFQEVINGDIINRETPIMLNDVDCDNLILVTISQSLVTNISPIIHQFSNTPHNDIFNKILTTGELMRVMQLDVINGTYNTQAEVSLGDRLIDYSISLSYPWQIVNGQLLINNTLPNE